MGHSTVATAYGDNCLCCWDAGETPLSVYISFGEIEHCQLGDPVPAAPINDSFEIPQDPGDPCVWLDSIGPWHFRWEACWGGDSNCFQTWQIWDCFQGNQNFNCANYFDNILGCGAAFVSGTHGHAAIVYNTGPTDHSIGSLLAAINMEPHAETKFEFWPASEEKIVVRFARKSDATNILILVEPENL